MKFTKLMPAFSTFAKSAAITAAAVQITLHTPKEFLKYLERTNYRQEKVYLASGVAAIASSLIQTLSQGKSFLSAGQCLVAVAGLVDDLVEPKISTDSAPKGFKGHLGALQKGKITTGNFKILAIGAGALLMAAEHAKGSGRSNQMILLDAFNIAALANLINLFDLRPGRALKVAALGISLAALCGVENEEKLVETGKVAALMPGDLKGKTMLGDAGANIIGANLGYIVTLNAPTQIKVLTAIGALSLMIASEKVSFSAFIESKPWLNYLDQLGR